MGVFIDIFAVYMLKVYQGPGNNWLPIQKTPAPKPMVSSTARLAFSTALGGLRKPAGPMAANMAVVTTKVNRIDTAVLMATIWPNLAKGTMTQKKSGTVEITVVTALDTMATPT